METQTTAQTLFMSRTMYCPICAQKESPQKGNSFILYCGEHQIFSPIKLVSRRGQFYGYTPHLISWLSPCDLMSGRIKLNVSCAIFGCGIKFLGYNDTGQYSFQYEKVRALYLPINEFIALRDKWHDSGLKIIEV